MSLVHIGVALGLSAGAALLVTGMAMRPIEPAASKICAAGANTIACISTGDIRIAGARSGGSSLQFDGDRRHSNRHFHERMPGSRPDCDRDVRRHYVPGHGVISHVHVGPDCRVRKAYRSGSG